MSALFRHLFRISQFVQEPQTSDLQMPSGPRAAVPARAPKGFVVSCRVTLVVLPSPWIGLLVEQIVDVRSQA